MIDTKTPPSPIVKHEAINIVFRKKKRKKKRKSKPPESPSMIAQLIAKVPGAKPGNRFADATVIILALIGAGLLVRFWG